MFFCIAAMHRGAGCTAGLCRQVVDGCVLNLTVKFKARQTKREYAGEGPGDGRIHPAAQQEDAHEDHRHQGLSRLGRHPQPAPRQGRDRRGHLWLGRERPVGPREGGGRARSSTTPSSWSAATPCSIGALWQEMYRSQYFEGGRVLHGGHLGASTSPSTTSRARRWACRSTSCSAASSATAIPTFASTSRRRRAPEMIEQAQAADGAWLDVLSACPAPGTTARRIYEPRESIGDTAHWLVKAREALGDERRARHRLPPPPVGRRDRQLLPEDAVGHARLPRGADPRRDAGGLRSRCARMTDVPFAIGEEFASKWQFLPYIERGIHQFNRHRRLQCRRPHRGDEGRRLERGALRRPDAAQSARAGLHGGDGAHFGGGRELLVARMPHRPRPRSSASTTASSSPCR